MISLKCLYYKFTIKIDFLSPTVVYRVNIYVSNYFLTLQKLYIGRLKINLSKMAEVLNLCTFEPSVVPRCFYEWYILEELMFNLSEATYDIALKKVKEILPTSKNTIYSLIIAAATVRRFNFNIYLKLCREIGKTNNVYRLSPFSFLLSEKKLISSQQRFRFQKWSNMFGRSEDIIKIFEPDSIFNCIVRDDLDVFICYFFQKLYSGQIIEIDADFGSKFARTFTADSFAAWCGSFKIFNFLMIMNSVVMNKYLLQCAVEGGNMKIIKLCVSKGAEFGECFTFAIAYHRHDVSRYLLENFWCEKVNLPFCIEKCNTLYLSFLLYHKGLLKHWDGFYSNSFKWLHEKTIFKSLKSIIKEVDISWAKFNGGTFLDEGFNPPLHVASSFGRYDIVHFLVHHGALSGKNYRGQLATSLASINGQLKVLKYLVKVGIPCDEPTSEGYTPLLLAAMNGNTDCVCFLAGISRNVNYFYDKNSAINYAAMWRDVDMMEALLKAGSNIDNANREGLTPLNEVCTDSIICVQFLLTNHANMEIGDLKGRTPLINSIIAQNIPICSLLLHYNPDLDCVDLDGKSALYYAVDLGNIDIIMMLLSKKAKINQFDKMQINIVDFAIEKGNKDVINILQSYITKSK